MSVAVMTWVFRFSQSVGNDRLVLLAIGDRAHDDGSGAFPSMLEIAGKARCSERTARRSVRSLEALGELRVDRDGGGRLKNVYTVVMQTPLPMGLPALTEAEERAAHARAARSDHEGGQSDTPVKLTPLSDCHPGHPRPGSPVTGDLQVHPVHPDPPPRARGDHGPTVIGEAAKTRHQSPGALSGSLPRDHINHGWCGSRFCVTSASLWRYARRHSADADVGRREVEAWLTRVHDALGPDDSPGGNLWLEDLFDTWLVYLGKVKPVATSLRTSRRRDEPATARVPDADATKATLDQIRGWMS